MQYQMGWVSLGYWQLMPLDLLRD